MYQDTTGLKTLFLLGVVGGGGGGGEEGKQIETKQHIPFPCEPTKPNSQNIFSHN